MFCPKLIYSKEKCSTRCSHSAVSIGNIVLANGITKLQNSCQSYRRFILPE
jgi:hypothetical protein